MAMVVTMAESVASYDATDSAMVTTIAMNKSMGVRFDTRN